MTYKGESLMKGKKGEGALSLLFVPFVFFVVQNELGTYMTKILFKDE